MMKNKFTHKPVLLNEVLQTFNYLKNKESAIFVDGTVGLAGHSLAIAKQIINSKKQKTNKSKPPNHNFQIIAIDKDQEALKISQRNISKNQLTVQGHLRGGLVFSIRFLHEDFCNIKKVLINLGIDKVDGILLDLGVSSMQLDDKTRGFSFENTNQVLDMRMDTSQHKDAQYILNNYSKRNLENVLKKGEEKFYKKIANLVIETRKKSRIRKVGKLLAIINKAYPARLKAKKTNFATDTFRALRLEVNDEINRLDKSIEDLVDSLRIGGKLAIITFHSLEDRIVKHKFRELENPCTCPPKQPYCTCGQKPKIKILTKKPIVPKENEIADNPRARSAKLRIAEKI